MSQRIFGTPDLSPLPTSPCLRRERGNHTEAC